MAEKEDEYADIRDGLQEVEAKLPALGFDLPTPFDQTSLDAEAPDSDMLLHTLDMGPLAVPIPLSTPELEVPDQGLPVDPFASMSWGPPQPTRPPPPPQDARQRTWQEDSLPVSDIPNWSTSWYHLDSQDLALTAVQQPPTRSPIGSSSVETSRRLCPALSPFSCGSSQSEHVHLYDTHLQHQLYSISSRELESSGMRLPQAMVSTASSQGASRRPSNSNLAMVHAWEMARRDNLHRQGMARAHSEFLPSDIPLAPSDRFPPAMDALAPQHRTSVQWPQQDPSPSVAQYTEGLAAPWVMSQAVGGKRELPEGWTMNRSSSTPVPQNSATTEGKSGRRRTRRSGREQADLPSLVSAPASDSSLVPVVQSSGNSIRIVSGKGEFDFPAWRSYAKKPEAKRLCLTIRSNELDKKPDTTPPNE